MKKRLDQLLVELSLFPSRTRAQAAIMAGLVFVDGQKIDKAGQLVKDGVGVEVRGDVHPFVGRGGVKLAHALKEFNIDVTGRTALDVGASTGGFTDCLLQNGAAKIYAIDVGYGQLDWKLRNDLRVVVLERTNIKHFTWDEIKKATPQSEFRTPNLAVIDVSFISLSKVLPAVYNLLSDEAEVVALIKPQFEAKREQVGKGGIVRSDEVRNEVVEKVKTAAEVIGFKVRGLTQSPIEGTDGNVEFLVHLIK